MLTNRDFHLQTGNLGYKTGLSFTNGDYWVTNGILGLLFTVSKKMRKDLFDLAVKCMDYQCISDDKYGRIDDFEENSVEPTEELLEAIRILNDAQDKDYAQKCHIEQMVKLSEYELQKIYFEVIKELTKEEHLLDMVIPMYVEKDLINKD